MKTLHENALDIFNAAVQSVLPEPAVEKALTEWLNTWEQVLQKGNTIVISMGKAAWRMAAAAHQVMGRHITAGLVITKEGHSQGPIPSFEIMEAGHPVPDHRSVAAGERAMELVKNLTDKDHVIMLISGGGSALFEKPMKGVTLEEIMGITGQLLKAGASIDEINTIRKRLSAVKGGKFASLCQPATMFSIVLSDVLGDRLDVIASGPGVPDRSTSREAKEIAIKYKLPMSQMVKRALEEETPKTVSHHETVIAGNVSLLCQQAAQEAKRRGYTPLVLTTTLDCEARDAGKMLAAMAREICSPEESGCGLSSPCAVICGGETIVHVTGNGKGGRNQELALSAAFGIEKLENIVILSAGSDGTDGPTDAAGGLVDGQSLHRMRQRGIQPGKSLADNDSYHALKDSGDLVITGPTGTNVNDLMMILCR